MMDPQTLAPIFHGSSVQQLQPVWERGNGANDSDLHASSFRCGDRRGHRNRRRIMLPIYWATTNGYSASGRSTIQLHFFWAGSL